MLSLCGKSCGKCHFATYPLTCNSNLLELTVSSRQEYVIAKCLPTLLEKRKEELNNPHLNIEFILHENNIKNYANKLLQVG